MLGLKVCAATTTLLKYEDLPICFFFVVALVGFWFLVFETGFLCSFGAYPGTHFVDQGDLLASASRVLGLEPCATTTILRHTDGIYRMFCISAMGKSVTLAVWYSSMGILQSLVGCVCVQIQPAMVWGASGLETCNISDFR